ncbi:MAG: histone deacetylase [Spirochaetes bacterium]|nr:histone deacetylase [Spirochaetota bacterium]
MKTAYLFDPIFIQHDPGFGHPERPERLVAIHSAISESPLWKELLVLKPQKADIEIIEKNHSKKYIEEVKRTAEKGGGYLDMDTGLSAKSFEAALYAVGAGVVACDAIMEGKAVNGFCAVRPPGHHAEYDYASGFCLFNNVAIAARYLREKYGCERIAIFDWDVHHGNGTQHSFEEDDTVFYLSTHQMPLFPGTGSEREIGKGKGKGYTLNVPLEPGTTEREYLHAFRKKIIPAIESFKPNFILISAGFDAHKNDPLASIKLESRTYYTITKELTELAQEHCGGKMLAFLEGGYNLTALSEGVLNMMEALVESAKER